MKKILTFIPILYALCIGLKLYWDSTWIGGLIEEPSLYENILSCALVLCFILAYIFYYIALRGKKSLTFCYILLSIHFVLYLISMFV